MRGSTEKTNNTYDVKVTRAKEIKEGQVVFDMVVNDITIYGCWYNEGKDKNDRDYTMVSFPSQKSNNGKYYNHCWFKIDDSLKEEIIAQLEKLV